MQVRLWMGLLAFGFGLGLVAAVPVSGADKATPEEIAKLVEKLGSGEFAEREKAVKQLEALGEQAIDALKKAVKSEDVETRKSATALLKKAEAAVFTKKILEPTKVRLTFKDTPLKDALAEVTKKTGLNLQINDPENKLAERKVTLDTGETTLWEAVDQFVQKAGLTESVNPNEVIGPGVRPVPQPPIRIQPIQPIKPIQKQILPVQPVQPNQNLPGAIQVGGGVAPAQLPLAKPGRPGFTLVQPNTLTLTDGKSDPLPTAYAGAVRIRALPAGTQIPGFQGREGELSVALQVTPEPKLTFQSVVNVRIDKAIDDQDQNLLQSIVDAGNDNPNPAGANGGALVAKAFIVRPPVMAGGAAPVPVRFKKGEKASKSLKEMTGVVSVEMRTAPEALMSVEKLMDAAGKEIKGENGGRLKISDVSKDDKGTTLKFEFEQPLDAQGGGGGIFFPGGPIQILPAPVPVPLPAPAPAPKQLQLNNQIQVVVPLPAVVPPPVVGGGGIGVAPGGWNGLTVQDDKGNSIPMNITQAQPVAKGANGLVWTVTMTVPTVKGQAEPAKLVYSGTKLVTVDVPFTLKNVPVQ
jgi:hypothetical protein